MTNKLGKTRAPLGVFLTVVLSIGIWGAILDIPIRPVAGATVEPAVSFPTNPFYNPGGGVTTFGACYHSGSGGTLVCSPFPTINTGCIDAGSGTLNGLLAPVINGQQQQCLLYTVNGSGSSSPGLLTLPVGMYGDGTPVMWSSCNSANPSSCTTQTLFNYAVKLPGSISDQCTGVSSSTQPCYDESGFDLKTAIVGNPYLLDPSTCNVTTGACTGDPTCTTFGSNWPTGDNIPSPDAANNKNSPCWQSDLQIIQQAQSRNPPCTLGVTVCIFNSPKPGSTQNVTLTNPMNNTTTFVNPFNGNVQTYQGYTYTAANCPDKPGAVLVNENCQVTVNVVSIAQKVWYLYRYVSSIGFQIIPPAIQPYCIPAQTTNYCAGGSPSCALGNNCLDDRQGVLSSFAQAAISNIGKISVLSNTQIAFGVTVPPLAALTCSQSDIISGNCWWGIIGMWVGGQGLQTAGCSATTSSCGFNPGTSQPHVQLPIYSCPQMTPNCSAALPTTSQLTYLATLNNQSVANFIASQAKSQVFSYITTQDFGVVYSCQGGTNCPSCTVASLGTCFVTPTAVVVNVPFIYDILGTQQLARWAYQYPAIPPQGGNNVGNIVGKVTNAKGAPLVGACIAIGGLCGQGGNYQRYTNTQGLYSFSSANLPAGPGQIYSVYASDTGYLPQYANGVALSSPNAFVEVDFALNPLPSPPSQESCLIPPITLPSVTPFSPPTYIPGLLCIPPIPGWVLPSIFILLGLGMMVILAFTPLGQSLGALGFAGASRMRRRGKYTSRRSS